MNIVLASDRLPDGYRRPDPSQDIKRNALVRMTEEGNRQEWGVLYKED